MLVERNEGVARVRLASTLLALRAVVPVGAIEALVTNAVNVLDRSVHFQDNGTRIEQTLSQPSQIAQWRSLRPGGKKSVAILFNTVAPEAGAKPWLGW